MATRRQWAILAALIAAASCGERPTRLPNPEQVTFANGAGDTLVGTLYWPMAATPPGLVLVPMAGADRSTWDAFANHAQRAGYACLAIDPRGHGETAERNSGQATFRTFSREDWHAITADIAAAHHFLEQRGVDGANLGLAGAALGGSLALEYAASSPAIHAVVLLSPGLEYEGIDAREALARYGKRPLLMLAAQGDSYAAASARTLKAQAPGYAELREYAGAAHGTDLFTLGDRAAGQIIVWLDEILKPQGDAAAP